MQKTNLNFRQLIKFKKHLFSGDEMIAPGATLSRAEFMEIWNHPEYKIIRDTLAPLEQDLLKELTTSEGLIDLNTFTNLIELYQFLPKKLVKTEIGYPSPDMHLIMSNNAKDHATAEREQSTIEDSRLKRNLELIWLRIDERFQSFANAFRFFDMNFNNRVSFNEFSQGIETLKVKITLREQMECFNYLDKGAKEYITYDDFCGLTKERRS